MSFDALLPLLATAGKHPARVEGHTDAKGSDSYNQTLSEKRAHVLPACRYRQRSLPL